MYGLPESTLLRRQIAKGAIFKQCDITPAQRRLVDAQIVRIDIVACLSPDTLPAISTGQTIPAIYVLTVTLRGRQYAPDSIALLARIIPQRMLFVLRYEEEVQLAVLHEGLHTGSWCRADELQIPIRGLTLDAVWETIVATVAEINLTGEQTLEEEIEIQQERAKLQKQIARLKGQIRRERSIGRKMELRAELNRMKSKMRD